VTGIMQTVRSIIPPSVSTGKGKVEDC
jgi:hypothetical protein